MNKIKNFYFTYGTSESYPFQGGWTKIEAFNRECAIQIFKALHPNIHEGIINCCDMYTEEEFRQSEMWSKGNLGFHEQEVILMQYINIKERQNKMPWED